jgi:flagellar biogenesis protein FliO
MIIVVAIMGFLCWLLRKRFDHQAERHHRQRMLLLVERQRRRQEV